MRPIKCYEGLYSINEGGEIFSHRKNALIKPSLYSCGYFYAVLYGKEKRRARVHRLVAETFIPNPFNFSQVNHKNGNKLDNSVENLEWCTAKQNTSHAIETGLRHPHSILNKKQVEEIRSLYIPRKKGHSTYALGKRFGVHYSTISKIITGVNWS